MAWTRRDQADYDRLREKRRAGPARDTGQPRSRRTEPDGDDGDHIMVFSGRRADTFIDRMFGSGATDDDEDDGDDDDEDDGEEEPQDDPEPPAGNRFFKGSRR